MAIIIHSRRRLPVGSAAGILVRSPAYDEWLTPMTSGKTISTGTRRYDATSVYPHIEEKVAPIRALVGGFVPPNILHAVTAGEWINLGRVWAPHVPEENREGLRRAVDKLKEALEQLPGTKPSDLVATTFGSSGSEDDAHDVPPHEKPTTDAPAARPTPMPLLSQDMASVSRPGLACASSRLKPAIRVGAMVSPHR